MSKLIIIKTRKSLDSEEFPTNANLNHVTALSMQIHYNILTHHELVLNKRVTSSVNHMMTMALFCDKEKSIWIKFIKMNANILGSMLCYSIYLINYFGTHTKTYLKLEPKKMMCMTKMKL